MTVISRLGLTLLLTQFLKIMFKAWDLANVMTVEERLTLLVFWVVGSTLFITGVDDKWLKIKEG